MKYITAKVSCFARAFHHRENTFHIFDDTAAEALLGDDYSRIAQTITDGIGFFLPVFRGKPEDGLRLIVDRQLSPSVLGRSAFCEKMLETEKRLGCGQYLIFASGYDTFSLRNTDARLSVYELDLPEVLEDKKKRIENSGLESCAVFVPCSLTETKWTARLLESGYRPKKKSFGSLLGISYYLTKSEFRSLIRSIGSVMTAGSAACFDYPSVDAGTEAEKNRTLAQGAGEPMKSLYSYTEMEALLSACGFHIYEFLDSAGMTGRFFSDYNKCVPERSLCAPEGVCYIHAVYLPDRA